MKPFFDMKVEETPAYSFVVPAYNEEKHLGATLQSLSECMIQEIGGMGEVVVVDNNSSDRTSEVAKKWGARVVFEEVNQISRARNKGASEARGKYLFFVDADTLVPKKLFLNAYAFMNERRGGGGGSVLVFDHSLGSWFWGRWIPFFWNWLSRSLALAAGSFLFCRKEFWEESGGFSEKVYAGEEIFFSRKIKKLCKRETMKFTIFSDHPVITSSRKLRWFSSWQLLGSMLIIFFVPFAIRSRKLCAFWYRRPASEGKNST